MPIDLSIAKAIIKRSLTDEDLLRTNRRYNHDWLKKKASKTSPISWYKALKKFHDGELQNCLLLKEEKKSRISRYEECSWIYLDIETAANQRKSDGIKYPNGFYIRMKSINTKDCTRSPPPSVDLQEFDLQKFEQQEIEEFFHDYVFLTLSTHCLERIIQRSNKETVKGVLELFKPVAVFFLKLGTSLVINRATNKNANILDRYLIYWREGYMILKYEEHDLWPVLLTWLPKPWFSEEQFAKFINFEEKVKSSSAPFIFDASNFNEKRILTESDLIEIKFSEAPKPRGRNPRQT